MADNPTEQFNKEIVITLKSTMLGMKAALSGLEDMKKVLTRVEKSSQKTDKATVSMGKAYAKAAKDLEKTKHQFKSLKMVQKGAYETARSLGKAVVISMGAATTAMGAFVVESMRIGDALLRFETTSLNASKALNMLGVSYGNLSNQANSAILSIQDVASALADFQSKGIGYMAIAADKVFQAGFGATQGVASLLVGKKQGDADMKAFVESMSQNVGLLEKNIRGKLGKLAQQIQTATDPKVKATAINQMIMAFNDLRVAANDGGIAAHNMAQRMAALRDATLGVGNNSTMAIVAIRGVVVKMGTTLENLSARMVEIFGPHLATLMNEFSSVLDGPVGGAIKYVTTMAEKLSEQFSKWGGVQRIIKDLGNAINRVKANFQAWGGVEKLIQSMGKALEHVYNWIVYLGEKAIWFGSKLLESNTAAVILAGTIATMVLAPGLITSVGILASGLKLVGLEAAIAAQSLSGAQALGMGAIGLGAKGARIGMGGVAGHLGGKALASVAGAEKGGWAELFAGAAGAAGTGAMMGGPWGAVIAGVGSLLYSGTKMALRGNEEDRKERKSKEAREGAKVNGAISTSTPQVATELEKIQAETEKLQVEQLKKYNEELKKIADEAAKAGDSLVEFSKKSLLIKTETERILPGYSAAVSGLSSVLKTLGPIAKMNGEQLSEMIDRVSENEMMHAFESLRKAAKLAEEALVGMDNAATDAKHDEWLKKYGEAMEMAAKAAKNLEQSLKEGLAPLETHLEKITAIKDLRQLDLEIAQQLYGTPSLAVQAQLDIVNAIQAQKENLMEQLAVVQRRMDMADEEKMSEEKIFKFLMMKLELQKKIKGLVRDQLKLTKELRDGYLDAIVAASFGAGQFSKLLISQEQNVGRGLLKGAIKPSFLLGQTGAAAGAYKADPYRYSAGGAGYMETLGGGIMGPEDTKRAVYGRIANIADPTQRAAAMQGANAFMDIQSGATKNTRDIITSAKFNSDQEVDAFNAFTDKFTAATATGLALKGVPAGMTATGSAMQKAGRGHHPSFAGIPMLTAVGTDQFGRKLLPKKLILPPIDEKVRKVKEQIEEFKAGGSLTDFGQQELERLKHKLKVLKEHKEKHPGKLTPEQRRINDLILAQRAREKQAAANAAMGTGYTKDPSLLNLSSVGKVLPGSPSHGTRFRMQTGNIEPGKDPSRVGVSNPRAVRTLGGQSGGESLSKLLHKASRALGEAAPKAGEMEAKIQDIDEERDQITQQAPEQPQQYVQPPR